MPKVSILSENSLFITSVTIIPGGGILLNFFLKWSAIKVLEIITAAITRKNIKIIDIVFVDLPDQGSSIEQGKSFGSVESVKAVEDMNAPISGEIVEVNSSVLDNPESLQNDPHGSGWLLLVKPSDSNQLNQLMSSSSYSEKVAAK